MTDEPVKSLEVILCPTAFAAGAVDIIAFAKLGGIRASAMTGNLAFLAFYISRFSVGSAWEVTMGQPIGMTNLEHSAADLRRLAPREKRGEVVRRLLALPAYSPELKPMENVWDYLRGNKFSSLVWDSYEAMCQACTQAWRFLVHDPARIVSIGTRE